MQARPKPLWSHQNGLAHSLRPGLAQHLSRHVPPWWPTTKIRLVKLPQAEVIYQHIFRISNLAYHSPITILNVEVTGEGTDLEIHHHFPHVVLKSNPWNEAQVTSSVPGLTTSAGDPGMPQVPGQKYLQVLHLRLQISSFPRIMADPGIDFGFLQVLVNTCQFVIT